MPKLLDRIRELRLKYGPLVRLAERSSLFLNFIERRPVLKPILERLKPQPLLPEDFINELQRLIVNARPEAKILIYSPYLYDEAVERYLGVMETAAKKGVKIVVYTLTPEHYSIRRKNMHRSLIEKLRKAGVEVRERTNMHEKAVIVLDGENMIAYFGSLNPLSKYKGKADYMLKFTHPEVVNALYLFLETLAEESEREVEE